MKKLLIILILALIAFSGMAKLRGSHPTILNIENSNNVEDSVGNEIFTWKQAENIGKDLDKFIKQHHDTIVDVFHSY